MVATPPGGPLIRTLEGHMDRVIAVAVTLDGRRAMSASGDRTLRLFDLESGCAAVSSACKFSTAARSDLTVAGGQRPPLALSSSLIVTSSALSGLSGPPRFTLAATAYALLPQQEPQGVLGN